MYFIDWTDRSGSQGQGHQSLGQNSTEFNFFRLFECKQQFFKGIYGQILVFKDIKIVQNMVK